MAGQGSESRLARPAAEGEDTGRDGEGEARPLTRQERPKPIGKGEEQGRSPLDLPPQPVRQGRTREVQKPKRFLVKPEGREERSGSAEGGSPSAGSIFRPV
jgi:hypothetical protein